MKEKYEELGKLTFQRARTERILQTLMQRQNQLLAEIEKEETDGKNTSQEQ